MDNQRLIPKHNGRKYDIITFMNTILIILLIICCLFAFAVICSVIDNKRLVTREYVIESNKISKDCRIVFLSDMHDNEFGEDNTRLVSSVKNAKPDYILIGGDMITAHPGCSYEKAVKLVSDLYAIDVPIIYGMGNHEYRMDLYREDYGDGYDKLVDELTRAGATVVRNEAVSFDESNIDVQGLMIDRVYYKRWKGRQVPTVDVINEYTGERDDSKLRIMLAHNPEYFDVYSACADIVLSGHVHGGIAVLPILGGVVSPRLTLFPKYDGGRFVKNNQDGSISTMVISRGLGSHTIPFRIFNPCEMVVIDIKANR